MIEGSDGTLTIEEDSVVLEFQGWRAHSDKKNASPRRIPLSAIASVELHKPGLNGGHLRLVLAGWDDNEKFNRLKSLDCLLLPKRKLYEAAKTAVEELQSKIGGADAVPDPELLPQRSAVAAAAVAPKPEPTGDRKRDKKESLAYEASLGGKRPDIAQAVERVRWTFGGKREIRHLHEHVFDDETVEQIAQGTYDSHQGIVVLTDQRLLFLFVGIAQQVAEDFPLNRLTAVSSKQGVSTGTLVVHTGGAQASISGIVQADLKAFVAALRERIKSN